MLTRPLTQLRTRSPDECAAIANRQRSGEELGFSRQFMARWASEVPSKARAAAPPKGKPAAKRKPAVKGKGKPAAKK